jgi:hypothetical protein
MNDMTAVIVPKSDQLNSDDLISGPRTIRITGVSIRPGTEQPVSIHFDGDNNKPWKTCKSMNRVLVHAWGADATAYVGRSVTIYRDPDVKWGGMKVGGIRISHLSNIEREMVMALTETKGKRTPFIVKPLANAQAANNGIAQTPELTIDQARADIAAAPDLAALEVVWRRKSMAPFRDELKDALDAQKSVLSFEPEGRADADHGDQRDGSVAGDLSGDE